MNIKKLEVGMVIKNYKELCEILEQEIKTGGAKQNQIKWFQEYFSFEKQGNKFLITEIFNKEVEKMVDNRGKSEACRANKVNYIENIEMLILNLLSQGKTGYKIYLSKNALLKELKMVNENYSFCKARIPKLSKFMDVDKQIIEEWFDSTSNMLERNLEKALDNLNNKSLIVWSKLTTVVEVIPTAKVGKDIITKNKKIDEFDEEIITYKVDNSATLNHRPALEKEDVFILEKESEMLEELNCKNKYEVIKFGLWDKFISKVNDKLLKEFNIAYYYKSYKVLFNEKKVLELVEDLCDFDLDKTEKTTNQILLNKGVSDRINKNIQKKYDRACKELNNTLGEIENDKKIKLRTNENYINDNLKLTDSLILLEAKNIKKDVKQTKLK